MQKVYCNQQINPEVDCIIPWMKLYADEHLGFFFPAANILFCSALHNAADLFGIHNLF